MYEINQTKAFKKSLRQIQSSKLSAEILLLINLLAKGEKLESRYRDHQLKGEY